MDIIQLTDDLKSYFINNNIKDIWVNSKFEWIKNSSTCKKGSIGETLINTYFTMIGNGVCKRTSVENDIVINNEKIEVKLSCLNKTGYFKWLQIRLDDDYDFLYLISVYPNDVKIYKLSKVALLELGVLKNQHGGKRNTNYNIKYLGIKNTNIPEWLKNSEIK